MSYPSLPNADDPKKIDETVEVPEGREPFDFDRDLKKAAEEVKKIIEEENAGKD